MSCWASLAEEARAGAARLAHAADLASAGQIPLPDACAGDLIDLLGEPRRVPRQSRNPAVGRATRDDALRGRAGTHGLLLPLTN
jgi:hypothetical protein